MAWALFIMICQGYCAPETMIVLKSKQPYPTEQACEAKAKEITDETHASHPEATIVSKCAAQDNGTI